MLTSRTHLSFIVTGLIALSCSASNNESFGLENIENQSAQTRNQSSLSKYSKPLAATAATAALVTTALLIGYKVRADQALAVSSKAPARKTAGDIIGDFEQGFVNCQQSDLILNFIFDKNDPTKIIYTEKRSFLDTREPLKIACALEDAAKAQKLSLIAWQPYTAEQCGFITNLLQKYMQGDLVKTFANNVDPEELKRERTQFIQDAKDALTGAKAFNGYVGKTVRISKLFRDVYTTGLVGNMDEKKLTTDGDYALCEAMRFTLLHEHEALKFYPDALK